ncbi:peptidoglycan-binding protein [Phytomonospora sp. NPDC050363]|uniref:peptidoglycan-binding domain-containing protein n=1 Tax=Phytomonospora sp. NPDC050363 TaxID=3155642 RepID=UPI0033DFFAAC
MVKLSRRHFSLTLAVLCAGVVAAIASPGPASAASWPVIDEGATGSSVSVVQLLLRAHGHTVEADGDFGPATESAVVAFQSAKGLTADGIVGPQTWGVLIITVRQGDRGDAVKAAQTALNVHGSGLAVDGVFGPGTAAAARSFQSAKGLTADGVVGPQTWQNLVSGTGGCSVPPGADPNVLVGVYRVATGLGVDDRVLLAGFEAGWVESRMNNLPCGDRDSLGVFQQRPSQGWGTPEQIMNVSFASNSFFTRAINVAAAHPSWTAGQVAQAVQVSAFPDRYDAAEATARALIEQARGLAGGAAAA